MQHTASASTATASRPSSFSRSLLVGALATGADWTVLEVLVRVFSTPALMAKAVALLLGVSVQFIGARWFAFQATQGSLRRQLALFGVVEVVSLVLHWALFATLLRVLHAPMELANLIAPAVVYLCFSYPLWKLVFRASPTPAAAH